jgi:hypothetical protein
MPMPSKFEVSAIVDRNRGKILFGRDKPPIGRQKGNVAKVTRDLKAGIINGAIAHGADGEGLNGLDGYLQMCATRYPKQYMQLLGKLMPHVINADVSAPYIGAVNIVSIPSGRYLSQQDIERLREPPPQLEHVREGDDDTTTPKAD